MIKLMHIKISSYASQMSMDPIPNWLDQLTTLNEEVSRKHHDLTLAVETNKSLDHVTTLKIDLFRVLVEMYDLRALSNSISARPSLDGTANETRAVVGKRLSIIDRTFRDVLKNY